PSTSVVAAAVNLHDYPNGHPSGGFRFEYRESRVIVVCTPASSFSFTQHAVAAVVSDRLASHTQRGHRPLPMRARRTATGDNRSPVLQRCRVSGAIARYTQLAADRAPASNRNKWRDGRHRRLPSPIPHCLAAPQRIAASTATECVQNLATKRS